MTEYITKEQTLEAFVEWTNSREDYAEHPVWFARNISSIKSADVVEREKINRAIDEIDFLRQHRAKYITEDNKICIDSGEVLKILKNIGE